MFQHFVSWSVMTSKCHTSFILNTVLLCMMVLILYHSVEDRTAGTFYKTVKEFGSQEDTHQSLVNTALKDVLQVPSLSPTKAPNDNEKKGMKNKGYYSKEVTDFLCIDEQAITGFQMSQWYEAVDEIFGDSHNVTSPMTDKEMGFYKETYGAMNIQLNRFNPLKLESILYHRIYKNGNDNIRSLLYEYAYYMTNEHQKFIEFPLCPADKCAHKNVQSFYNPHLRAMNATVKRFAFTFVREPIVRFVSAVNEIESRAYLDTEKTNQLNLKEPLGSYTRFMEFIDKVLRYGPSKFLFRDNENIEMGHIAPMIGTLILAKSVDKNPLHLYRFENFKSEWNQLSIDTRLPELKLVFDRRTKPTDWVRHASATDPVNATKASLQFLSLAGRDAKRRFGFKLPTSTPPLQLRSQDSLASVKALSQKYLKALCRIYLIDYICTNYELPVECAPLKVEIVESVKLMKLSSKCSKNPTNDPNCDMLMNHSIFPKRLQSNS